MLQLMLWVRTQVFFSPLFSSGQSNSKVTAHIGEDDFTVRINTDEEEYNVEVHLSIGI